VLEDETEIGGDDEQLGTDSLNLSASSPTVVELERPAMSDDDDDDNLSEHSDKDKVGENVEENYEVAEDVDEVVDVVDHDHYDNEDDSTTRSLSPFEPQPSPKVTRGISHWLGDDPEAMRNSLLFDADAANSMSSEADSVDVVSSMAVDDRHAAELAREMSPALVSAPVEPTATPLQDLEEFADRRTHVVQVGDDSSERADDGKNTSQMSGVLSQSWPQLSEPPSEQAASPQPVTTASNSQPTSQIGDVRRGAMWRDSLFPSDFLSESTTTTATSEAAAGKSAGKPAIVAEKPGTDRTDKASSVRPQQRTLSLEWEAGQQQQRVDVLSARGTQSSSTPACRGSFPPATPLVSNLQYQYGNTVDKPPLPDLQGGSFRCASGRRSVGLGGDNYSRGLIYDTAGSAPQHQRAASVKPTLAGYILHFIYIFNFFIVSRFHFFYIHCVVFSSYFQILTFYLNRSSVLFLYCLRNYMVLRLIFCGRGTPQFLLPSSLHPSPPNGKWKNARKIFQGVITGVPTTNLVGKFR